jgi:HD-GYP domain-containing protein (c-di-GMP phosphodiesterase class II)
MKQHVVNGIRILSEEKDFPKNAFYPVVEHHERLTGGGYPRGIRSSGIHTIGRITSLVDTYDALTTARPYKRALTPFESLTIIERQIGDFDRDILMKFIKMLGSIR